MTIMHDSERKAFAKGAQKAEGLADERSLSRIASALERIADQFDEGVSPLGVKFSPARTTLYPDGTVIQESTPTKYVLGPLEAALKEWRAEHPPTNVWPPLPASETLRHAINEYFGDAE